MMNSLPAFAAALCAVALGLAVLIQKHRSLASWLFLSGMVVLGLESAVGGLSLQVSSPENSVKWLIASLIAKSYVQGIWLAFSLVYARGNFRDFLSQRKWALAGTVIVPVGLAVGVSSHYLRGLGSAPGQDGWISFGEGVYLLNVFLLICSIAILVNFEKTFRSAVGTMRWRIKFVMVGFAVLFGARIYTHSQAILFHGYHSSLAVIDAWALLVACGVIGIGYMRSGSEELDLYPSREVLQNSVIVLLAGGYLFVVGVIAQIVTFLGGVESFQAQAFVVLLGVVGLSLLLLSDRAHSAVRSFVSRHFRRPEHDYRLIWEQFTLQTSQVLTRGELCMAAVKLISKTFNALSVTMFLVNERENRLDVAASTCETILLGVNSMSNDELFVVDGLQCHVAPFNLDLIEEDWTEALKKATPIQFPHGGHRICVPLKAQDQLLGIAILADRVDGIRYTQEELDLLGCLGGQAARALLNLELTQELIGARELTAFQTMSTFFVHDMKNLASRLNLTLSNMPEHFDDPEFRKDALRTIGSTVERINLLITRLSTLRSSLVPDLVETDLNQLVSEVLDKLEMTVSKNFQSLPKVLVDREQFQSVVTNLVLNACEAACASSECRVSVETAQSDDRVILSVEDDGCGMSPEFLENALFRPFQSTKKQGLGIGMFQSKAIVEAHGGRIRVVSELGKGTTFKVSIPFAKYAKHASIESSPNVDGRSASGECGSAHQTTSSLESPIQNG